MINVLLVVKSIFAQEVIVDCRQTVRRRRKRERERERERAREKEKARSRLSSVRRENNVAFSFIRFFRRQQWFISSSSFSSFF